MKKRSKELGIPHAHMIEEVQFLRYCKTALHAYVLSWQLLVAPARPLADVHPCTECRAHPQSGRYQISVLDLFSEVYYDVYGRTTPYDIQVWGIGSDQHKIQ